MCATSRTPNQKGALPSFSTWTLGFGSKPVWTLSRFSSAYGTRILSSRCLLDDPGCATFPLALFLVGSCPCGDLEQRASKAFGADEFFEFLRNLLAPDQEGVLGRDVLVFTHRLRSVWARFGGKVGCASALRRLNEAARRPNSSAGRALHS